MKRTILFIDHAAGLGGAERSLLLLVKHLDPSSWDLHLATVAGQLAVAAQKVGVTGHLISFPRLRRSPRAAADLWRGGQAIATLANEIDAQILHSNTVRASVFAALAAKLSKRPFVWHFRDFWLSEAKPKRLWLDGLLKRWLLASSNAVIVNSAAVQNALPQSEKVHVVHNGIDFSHFLPSHGAFQGVRHQLRLEDETAVIGMVGRLRPWKGQETFLRMAKQIHQAHANVHFLIVGGNPLQEDSDYSTTLKRMRRDMGLETAVSFLGQLEDVRPALAAMDIFVHPGAPEPFGLVNVEAMAMGKPVVAFAHGALPEIVEHNKSGILVQPQDEAAMVHACLSLLNEPKLAQKMGELGRIRAIDQFDVQKTAVSISNIFHGICVK